MYVRTYDWRKTAVGVAPGGKECQVPYSAGRFHTQHGTEIEIPPRVRARSFRVATTEITGVPSECQAGAKWVPSDPS